MKLFPRKLSRRALIGSAAAIVPGFSPAVVQIRGRPRALALSQN